MYSNAKYAILMMLITLLATVSCIYEPMRDCQEESSELEEGVFEGYSLSFKVTLDRLGGSEATKAGEYNPLEFEESYIDPEKFRVLFFDKYDKFLFESKSRWVKQLSSAGNGSEWLVSVPMYPYGNDEQENWEWDKIREVLTTQEFKIAILANRPRRDWYPGFANGVSLTSRWYDNEGPYWSSENTRWGTDTKTVFDLHHCQFDPMYLGKSHDKTDAVSNIYGVYDFVMGNWKETGQAYSGVTDATPVSDLPTMSSTASWVEWKEGKGYDGVELRKYDKGAFGDRYKNTGNSSGNENAAKYSINPSMSHPIPMYGIQLFNPITAWIKGTPFNLSNITNKDKVEGYEYEYKSISLLRSVVKLELWIGKTSFPTRPSIVTLWYSNIYSRCEPMNVWDPTDEIWKDHDNGCEWRDIMNYGPICSDQFSTNNIQGRAVSRWPDSGVDNTPGSGSILNYQTALSWYYGVWSLPRPFDPDNPGDDVDKDYPNGKPRWMFEGKVNGFTIKDIASKSQTKSKDYPNIFNPCIQRNKIVLVNVEGDLSDKYNDGYWHFVAYTGERNMIDPNRIPQMRSTSYAINWMFKNGTVNDTEADYYCIPIADYNDGHNETARNCFGPYKGIDFGEGNLPSTINEKKFGDNKLMSGYAAQVAKQKEITEMPWPLLRNHVYRIKIGTASTTTKSGETQLIVESSDDFHSKSLKID